MNDLFSKMDVKQKNKLLKSLETNTLVFKKNTTILSNVKENIIGVILSGNVQIIKEDYNGNRIITEELKTGDIFGTVISSLNDKEHKIITKETTSILIIDYDNIINMNNLNFPYYNQFIKNLLKITTNIINEKNLRIQILTKKTIRDKLLEYFDITSKDKGSKIIYLPFTFTDLADYLAVDRSAMSRELKNLKQEGFISVKEKRITLLYK